MTMDAGMKIPTSDKRPERCQLALIDEAQRIADQLMFLGNMVACQSHYKEIEGLGLLIYDLGERLRAASEKSLEWKS